MKSYRIKVDEVVLNITHAFPRIGRLRMIKEEGGKICRYEGKVLCLRVEVVGVTLDGVATRGYLSVVPEAEVNAADLDEDLYELSSVMRWRGLVIGYSTKQWVRNGDIPYPGRSNGGGER